MNDRQVKIKEFVNGVGDVSKFRFDDYYIVVGSVLNQEVRYADTIPRRVFIFEPRVVDNSDIVAAGEEFQFLLQTALVPQTVGGMNIVAFWHKSRTYTADAMKFTNNAVQGT